MHRHSFPFHANHPVIVALMSSGKRKGEVLSNVRTVLRINSVPKNTPPVSVIRALERVAKHSAAHVRMDKG